jgi:hypothetical protein
VSGTVRGQSEIIMVKIFISLCFFFSNIFLFAGSITELPENPINLGKIEISINKREYEIMLPYHKSEGIEKIFTSDSFGILICQIIGDGKSIRPVKKWFFLSDDTITFRHETEIDTDSMYLNFKMIWKTVLGGKLTDEKLKMGLFFNTYKGQKKELYEYNIPYNTKRIYITYRILFPDRPKTEATEMKAVYFEIDWP